MSSKVLVSDYDDTFYLNDKDIEKNKKAVEEFRKQKNIFVIATGRSYFDFKNKVNLYNIKYDYVIINHGATILDKNDNILANFYISNEIIKSIKKDLKLDKSVKYFCCSKLESRVNFDHKNLTKINVNYNLKKDAIVVNDMLNSKYFKYINSYLVNDKTIEITASKTDKSIAINMLLNELVIPKQNVYTIGNGSSDIKMIKEFNGYAIINSKDELKKVAKKEYKSVSDLIKEMLLDKTN